MKFWYTYTQNVFLIQTFFNSYSKCWDLETVSQDFYNICVLAAGINLGGESLHVSTCNAE